jgi:hypothetical protein
MPNLVDILFGFLKVHNVHFLKWTPYGSFNYFLRAWHQMVVKLNPIAPNIILENPTSLTQSEALDNCILCLVLPWFFLFHFSNYSKKISSCPKTYWVSGHLELILRFPMKAIFFKDELLANQRLILFWLLTILKSPHKIHWHSLLVYF